MDAMEAKHWGHITHLAASISRGSDSKCSTLCNRSEANHIMVDGTYPCSQRRQST